MKLGSSFYEREVLTVARELLGKIIVRTINGQKISARIVDCEAYPGALDRASHTYNYLKTERTRVLYQRAGILYVYSVYGLHKIANIVCGPSELGGGVMLRGIEPVTSDDYSFFSAQRFNTTPENLTTYQRKNLLNGPGKVTQALQINLKNNGEDLLGDRLYLMDDKYSDFEIKTATRIGIEYAKEAVEYPYRFYINKK